MNEPLEFEVMVMDDNILSQAVNRFNRRFNTDFQIVHTEYDEAIFCTLRVSKYTHEDIFNLGYFLSALEHDMRERGEFDW